MVDAKRSFQSLQPLPQGWYYRALDEFLKPGGLTYGIVQPGVNTPDGVPIVRVNNMRKGRVAKAGVFRVGHDIEAKYSRTRLLGGELLLSLVGSVGEVAIAPADLKGWNVARAIAVLRPKEGVSATWLKLNFETEQVRTLIRSYQNETVQATLNLRDVRRLPIVIPPSDLQSAIVQLMGAIDDKIIANERIAATCDELRKTAFLDEMGSYGSVPQRVPLSSVAQFVNGRAFTRDASGKGRMVVRIAELTSGPGASTVFNDITVACEHIASPGDILFAWSGSLTVVRWFRPEAIVNQHIFKVLPHQGYPTWMVYELLNLKLTDFKRIAADKATTMGHIQRRNLDEPILVPDASAREALDRQLRPLWDRALTAETENLGLVRLRDTLLPKLMSGELRVPDAEQQVEDAV